MILATLSIFYKNKYELNQSCWHSNKGIFYCINGQREVNYLQYGDATNSIWSHIFEN